MMHAHSLAIVLAMTLALAASSAVLPVVPLRDMTPEHACYFICEMCMAGGPEHELMDCVNNVCNRIPAGTTCGPVLDLGLLWLGHKCRHFQQVMTSMVTPDHQAH